MPHRDGRSIPVVIQTLEQAGLLMAWAQLPNNTVTAVLEASAGAWADSALEVNFRPLGQLHFGGDLNIGTIGFCAGGA